MRQKLDRRKTKWILIKRGRLVAKNINECWLDTNHEKGYINNERHFAGIQFRRIYEQTLIKTNMSYEKIRIDKGTTYVDPNLTRLGALDKLKIIQKEIGKDDYILIKTHCGQDYSYSEIAKKFNTTRQTVARRMKIALLNLFYVFNNNLV